jgi:hypothetical protein
MKTKKEILEPFIFQEDTNSYDVIYEEDALSAMEEYAKQTSIEFMKYVDAFYSQQVSSDSYEKMYSQFIESQNK